MFSPKIDIVGLESGSEGAIKVRSNAYGQSNSVLQIPKSDGSIIDDEVYGHIQSPNCEYAIAKTYSLSKNLGQVYSTKGSFALQSISVSTGAGQEPTLNATAVQIEQGATRSVCVYPTTAVTLSPARHASTFGIFTFTETRDLTLQGCDYNASITLDPTKINGEPVASDSTAGIETIQITMWSSSEENAPEITISEEGWHITSDWACTGADSSMFVWTATYSHYLAASKN